MRAYYTSLDLMDMFEDTNDIDTKWKIVQHIGEPSHGPKFANQYVNQLERMLVFLKDQKTKRATDIARTIATIKYQRNLIRKEDLLIMAEIESKANNIPKVIDLLTSYKSRYGKIVKIKNNKEEMFYHSIETKARIVEFWDDFKDDALVSDRILERILITFSENVVQDLFTSEDIITIHKRWIGAEGTKVSAPAQTTFLSLVTKFAPSHVFEFIDKNHEKIIHVSKESAIKALELAPNLPNFIDCLQCLKGLGSLASQDIWATDPLPTLWNNILSYSYRKDLVQFAEQVYGVMESIKIEADVQCAMMMLIGLCKNQLFEVFERRCQDLHKQNKFAPDFVFPAKFAEELSEILTNYEGNDTNVLHHMVKFLLQSSFPPQEHRIQEVLSMLVAKRRFSDVYDLVLKCFKTRIYLSQKDLRRAVYALEEWTHNLDASITVYEKMRQCYPRPEHQCVCGGNFRSHQPPARQLSAGDLASPKSSTGSNQDNITVLSGGNESIESNSHPTRQTNQQLFKISAELAAFSRDISRFAEIYEEACNIQCGNHDKILVGLFLGLTEKDISSETFQQFVLQIISKHDRLPSDVEQALARVGLRLIKYYHDHEMWVEAVDVVEVFHNYQIRYANAGEGFGTQMETKDDLSYCDISDLCSRTCIYGKKLNLAPAAFSHCNHCVNFEELSNIDQGLYIKLASDIITVLNAEFPEKTVEFFTSTCELFDAETFRNLLNKIVGQILQSKSITSKDKAGQLTELEGVSANKNALFHKTIRQLVVFYGENNQMENARKYFLEGRKMNVYQDTLYDIQPFLAEIKTDLKYLEIYLTIEFHIDALLKHPVGMIGKSQMLSKPLDLVVAPAADVDGDQFRLILARSMREIGRVLTKEFCPALQILATNSQKFTVCPDSIVQWHKHRSSQKQPSTESDRFVQQSQGKRSVDINGPEHENFTIKFCPTPSHQSDFTQAQAPSTSSAPSANNASHPTPDASRLVRYSATNNSVEAQRYIRKTLCTYMNREYRLKGGYFEDDDGDDTKFKEVAKELTEAFNAELSHRHGAVFYNEQIKKRIFEYVDDYYQKEDSTSHYGPDWAEKDAVINTDPHQDNIFDSY